jgi:hypothetical protein
MMSGLQGQYIDLTRDMGLKHTDDDDGGISPHAS